mmetsp:Transcript_37719/g.43345  ORF Transcript_37719/g.43345 Transcript_37719/m.43345 type:complete len:80 (+) Transcript_37719:438-677(+)
MSEEDTFWMINYLMDSSIIRKWITQDCEYRNATVYIFQRLCEQKQKMIFTSLKENNISPIFYSSTWFMTLFCHKFQREC